MSLPSNAYVYTGVWINWSRGKVLGSTITLTERSGSLLTAFLGIIVTTAGVSCWRILSFFLHQHRVKTGLSHAAHHQEQVILRNGSTPGLAAWQITQLLWAWRKVAKRRTWRSVGLIVLALCHLLLFATAGVLSGEVTKSAGNATLIRSDHCGFNSPPDNSDPSSSFDSVAAYDELMMNVSAAASTYVRSCYGTNKPGAQCYQSPSISIPIRNRTDVPCPFPGDICKDVGGYEMDTGFFDTHEILGINSKPGDRVELRKVTTCTILRSDGYTVFRNRTSTDNPKHINQTLYTIDFMYGLGSPSDNNYTYSYVMNTQGPYTLTSFGYGPSSHPVPALERTDADFTVMFLAQNSVLYSGPVYDPLFRATRPLVQKGGPDLLVKQNYTMFEPDEPVSVFACTDQVQFRNPNNGQTTSLNHFGVAWSETYDLGFNYVQNLTSLELGWAILFGGFTSSAADVGSLSLRAAMTLSQTSMAQPALPTTQWKIEAENLFSIALATIQQQILSYAVGPDSTPKGLEFTNGSVVMCTRQMYRGANGFLSFSTLGLSIIISLSTFFIIIPFFLDIAVGRLRNRFDWDDHKRIQWAVDEKLQLQRLAFELAGQGKKWEGTTAAVPVTQEDEGLIFGVGRNVDHEHPRLAGHGYTKVQTGNIIEHEDPQTLKYSTTVTEYLGAGTDRGSTPGRWGRSISPTSSMNDGSRLGNGNGHGRQTSVAEHVREDNGWRGGSVTLQDDRERETNGPRYPDMSERGRKGSVVHIW